MYEERHAVAGGGYRLPGGIDTIDGFRDEIGCHEVGCHEIGCREIRWQPKFADPAVAVPSLDLDELIRTLRGTGQVAVRVAEFSVADLADPASVSRTGGPLPEAAYDLIVADGRTGPVTEAAWRVIRRLLVPGGLALIRHASAGDTPSEAGWTRLEAPNGHGEQAALWAAPAVLFNDTAAEPEGPRWVIADGTALADMWAWWMVPSAGRVAMESLDTEWLWSAQAAEEMRGLRAADLFCDDDPGESGGHPPGERAVARCHEFVRALTAARDGASAPCRVTVITRRATFDAPSPASATLWRNLRGALGHELGYQLSSGIDLRLADVGEPTDLTALRWLARHDVRERELAVRDGRLYAPRPAYRR
jgi:hypothetical protein